MPKPKPRIGKRLFGDTPPSTFLGELSKPPAPSSANNRNRDSLRLAARERMKLLRSTNLDKTTPEGDISEMRVRARASAAKIPREDSTGTGTAFGQRILFVEQIEAFNEKEERPQFVKTQKRHEGRPPQRKAHAVPNHRPGVVSRKPRYNPREVLTENQKRCRTLRQCGFEEDNDDDSDADLPPGTCGCDKTECQRMHRMKPRTARIGNSFI
ncbi:hypothetical protein B0H13DRAFT_1888087 [Mycena leptocephala]|nr:hypothetical protein B0H13DRAFT_1888087 [Mycena leptocephala]